MCRIGEEVKKKKKSVGSSLFLSPYVSRVHTCIQIFYTRGKSIFEDWSNGDSLQFTR